jgi:hypothetical protein
MDGGSGEGSRQRPESPQSDSTFLEAHPMKKARTLLAVAALVATPLVVAGRVNASKSPDWSMNATIIEACSCPMFCQCYFNPNPAGHDAGGHAMHAGHGAASGDGGPMHFCKFNNAFKINKGQYGATKLDGIKFWVSGDLGGDFSEMKLDWAVLTFDKTSTPEQREAIGAITGALYPAQWKSFSTDEGTIAWDGEKAHALLDGGKSAEVLLSRNVNANDPSQPVVIKNLKYWGAPRNDGFVMMPNVVEAYRKGEKAFEYKGTNGFMITLDIDSKSAAM